MAVGVRLRAPPLPSPRLASYDSGVTTSAPRPTRSRALALLVTALTLVLTALSSPSAHADGHHPSPAPSPDPVRLVLTTAGLTWEDVDATHTPTLACLADHAGLAAMNTTSTTMVSTRRQGLETLHTGYRGLAATAPTSAGIPNPPVDQWEQLPLPTVHLPETPSTAASDTDTSPSPADGAATAAGIGGRTASALEEGAIVQVDLSLLPDHDDPDRPRRLATLDAQLRDVLAPLGGCKAALPRTLLVSVAATDPPDPQAVERTGAVASRTVGLQVYLDTAFPGEAISSGSTKQDGIIALTDVLPTVLASHDAAPSGRIQGQAIEGVAHPDPLRLVVDRSMAARLVDAASVPALLSWTAPALIAAVLLLIPPLAALPRLARAARVIAALGPLAIPAGLLAQVVPWWRAASPTWALIGTVWLLASALAAVVLLGPWRRSRVGLVSAAAALTAGVVLLESATGSHLQIGSPLGAQPISGGRFYGLSNHLFGVVLGATLMGLLCLFARVTAPRSRTLLTLLLGGVVAGVCVAPSMGADFGSMLVTVPAVGLLALLVSGLRVRLWHLLTLGAGGAVAVLGVSFLDWLRPAEQRTHLGRFVDDLLSGDLLAVVVRKLAQNVAMTTGHPGLLVLLLAALLASVILVAPHLVRWRRLQDLRAEAVPGEAASRVAPGAAGAAVTPAAAVLLVLVLATWAGYLVNDTGPVLVAGVVAVWLMHLPALLPDPSAATVPPAHVSSPASLPRAQHDGHRPQGQ